MNQAYVCEISVQIGQHIELGDSLVTPSRTLCRISRTRSSLQNFLRTFLKRGILVIMTNKGRLNVQTLEGCGGIENQRARQRHSF